MQSPYDPANIPPTLRSPRAGYFWAAVTLTGLGAGIATVILMQLLFFVQHLAWPGPHILDAAVAATPRRHIGVLVAAGLLTGVGQIVLRRLSSSNSIDITEAIANYAGRLPAVRTLGSALLSVIVVGMGASLGREGAPKQAGAVVANALSDRAQLSDEQRRLLVACGAGAGMAAAYGVPLGGALFAVEVLRGVLALRLILPALLASAIAAGVAWIVLPNEPTYVIPSYSLSASVDLLVDRGRPGHRSGLGRFHTARRLGGCSTSRRAGAGYWRQSLRSVCSASCRLLTQNCWETARISRSWPSPVRCRRCCY